MSEVDKFRQSIIKKTLLDRKAPPQEKAPWSEAKKTPVKRFKDGSRRSLLEESLKNRSVEDKGREKNLDEIRKKAIEGSRIGIMKDLLK